MATIYFEDIDEGTVWWGGGVVVDREEMLDYARKNDPWPFHVDDEAAKRAPFGGLIASGGYTITLWYRSMIPVWHGQDSGAFLGGVDWQLRFVNPVRPGDRLRNKWTLLEKRPSSNPGRGIWKPLNEMMNQNEEVVLSIKEVLLMATRPQDS